MSNQKDKSSKQVAFIREIIRTSYSYSNNEILFKKKINDQINSRSISDILELPNSADSSKLSRLTPKELEVYKMMENGFSAQEIASVTKKANVNSVYSMKYRIGGKLKGCAQVEILFVQLIIGIILYILIYLFQDYISAFIPF